MLNLGWISESVLFCFGFHTFCCLFSCVLHVCPMSSVEWVNFQIPPMIAGECHLATAPIKLWADVVLTKQVEVSIVMVLGDMYF